MRRDPGIDAANNALLGWMEDAAIEARNSAELLIECARERDSFGARALAVELAERALKIAGLAGELRALAMIQYTRGEGGYYPDELKEGGNE